MLHKYEHMQKRRDLYDNTTNFKNFGIRNAGDTIIRYFSIHIIVICDNLLDILKLT